MIALVKNLLFFHFRYNAPDRISENEIVCRDFLFFMDLLPDHKDTSSLVIARFL